MQQYFIKFLAPLTNKKGSTNLFECKYEQTILPVRARLSSEK
jgi:hypothetical protein